MLAAPPLVLLYLRMSLLRPKLPETRSPLWSSALRRVQAGGALAGDDKPGSGDDQPCGDHYIADEFECHKGGGTGGGQSQNWSDLEADPATFAAYKQKVARRPQGQGGPVELTAADVAIALKQGRYALLSAGRNPNNAGDMALSDEQINQRSAVLQQDLVSAGYMFTPSEGKYGGEQEDSFLVMAHETETEDVVALGRKYNQDSIIVADKGQQQMIFTSGENAGLAIRGQGFAPLPDDSPEYTKIQVEGGQSVKFSLNFDWDNMHKAIARLMRCIAKL